MEWRWVDWREVFKTIIYSIVAFSIGAIVILSLASVFTYVVLWLFS